jgi:hypothetical protein
LLDGVGLSHLSVFSFLDFGLAFNLDLVLFKLLSTVGSLVIFLVVGVRLLGREFGRGAGLAVPLDGKAGDTGLLGEDAAADLLDNGLGRGFGDECLVGVLIVNVVADANELATVVAAGQEDDSDAEDVAVRDAVEVWGVGFEDELVDANRDRANEKGVKLLVILGTAKASQYVGLRVRMTGTLTRWQSRRR